MSHTNVSDHRVELPIAPTAADDPDMSPRVVSTYMLGVYLGLNALRDAFLLVEAPDCVHMKTQYIQGNHDWLSTLTSVSGTHRIANTALHPVQMTASREVELTNFLLRMAQNDSVKALLFTSMPMAFITGVDYERLCRDVAAQTGKTLVHVKGKSLSGDWLDGYDEVLYSLARQIPLEKGRHSPEKVAIVGNLFDRNEWDHRANVKELKALLRGLGLETVSVWLEGGDWETLLKVQEAGTIVSLPYGRRAAKWVARRTGAKLVECELPFGLEATERWLRQVGEATGRLDKAEAVIDRELSDIVPSLEWVIPFVFQNRKWGFVGDPHLARGLHEIAHTVGAKLEFAVITDPEHHVEQLRRELGDRLALCVYPRQRTMANFVIEHTTKQVIDVLVATTVGVQASGPAVVEMGFPSMYTHHLYDRPFLGFRGALAFLDTVANAVRERELRRAMEGQPRGDKDGKGPDGKGPGPDGGDGDKHGDGQQDGDRHDDQKRADGRHDGNQSGDGERRDGQDRAAEAAPAGFAPLPPGPRDPMTLPNAQPGYGFATVPHPDGEPVPEPGARPEPDPDEA